jgi:putative transposase
MIEPCYRRNTGSVFALKYHCVWCPKYRPKMLVDRLAQDLPSLLYEEVQELDVTIAALESIPDDVHLLIASDPSEAPQLLANPFKGYTSRMLRLKYPEWRSHLASMCNRTYDVGTMGHVSEGTLRRNIEMQKSR